MEKLALVVALFALAISLTSLNNSIDNYNELKKDNDYIVEYPVADMTITCYNTKTNKIVDCED